MIEYNIETISRILKIEQFEMDELNLNQIQHIPMHEYRISSLEKPLLLIENLQVCIGLYAYSTNFGFAAHLNPVVMRGDEFQCDKNNNVIYYNRINDLYNSIIKSKIEDPIYIGISIGFNPVLKTYQQVNVLNKSIDSLIVKLNSMGIVATKLNLRNNHVYIVDVINDAIITPSSQHAKELTKILNKKQ